MKLSVLAVGKLKSPQLRALCDDYQKRILRHASLTEVELKDDAALLRALPKGARLVALEVNGRALSSTAFSERLMEWGSTNNGQICFIIGGAEGIPRPLSRQADFQLSLSTMTLPHRLARLLLFEQIYRALSIWKGEPYARED